MGKTVDVDALAEHAADYAFAYLITVGSGERIHTSVVHPEIADGAVTVAAASDHARANATGHPAVSLVWPPADERGYSLIVDGTGGIRGDALDIAPTRAILHRPAVAPSTAGAGDGCAQDCIELAASARTVEDSRADPGLSDRL